MQTEELRRLLAGAELAIAPDSVTALGRSSWSARTPAGTVVLRLVQPTDVNALRAVRALLQGPPDMFYLLQRLHACVDVEGSLIAVLEWVPGGTLREGQRDDLPAFFEHLARWHCANAGTLPLYSPYTNLEYPSVEGFLSDELAFHLRIAGEPFPRAVGWELLKPLTCGFSTYTHGDVHPGNIVKRPDQAYKLLDPESLHVGVNYLDLDYVDWLGLEPDPAPWWFICGQERESVASYFAALGADESTIPPTMTAVCLLTALRSHTNAVRFRAGNRAEVLTRLRSIVAGGLARTAD